MLMLSKVRGVTCSSPGPRGPCSCSCSSPPTTRTPPTRTPSHSHCRTASASRSPQAARAQALDTLPPSTSPSTSRTHGRAKVLYRVAGLASPAGAGDMSTSSSNTEANSLAPTAIRINSSSALHILVAPAQFLGQYFRHPSGILAGIRPSSVDSAFRNATLLVRDQHGQRRPARLTCFQDERLFSQR
eukprot:COSAG04_NODE_2281_length_4393_cov_48.920587_7_plen_187_part_00